MIVVSDASPVIVLAATGHLDLLHSLFGMVIIPRAVFREVALNGAGQSGATEVSVLDWIETRDVSNRLLVIALQLELDKGEAEAIALAIELKADLLLLDERRARMVASRYNIRFAGTLGVLIEAKSQGHLQLLRPILDELVTKAGFWISSHLYNHVLKTVGE